MYGKTSVKSALSHAPRQCLEQDDVAFHAPITPAAIILKKSPISFVLPKPLNVPVYWASSTYNRPPPPISVSV
jgi:hypothetical protein